MSAGALTPTGFRRRVSGRSRAAPEDSIALRVVVGAIVMVGVAAVISQGVVDPFTAVGAIVLPPIGFAFSYVQRHRSNWPTKVILAVALMAAFGAFLQNVRLAGSVDEARGSLAALFLWVQVLHSFDVPRRRDLAFSVAASVTLMAEAGALSLDTSFALYVIPWAILAGLWLVLTSRPRPETLTPARVVRRPAAGDLPARGPLDRLAPARSVGVAGIAVLVASALVFLATPRLPGAVVLTPPFSLRSTLPVAGFEGQVVNPGLPASGGDRVANFSANAYPGFGGRVDLRSRGQLSDELVMRVRSPQAALWRGEAFDVYDGLGWEASDERTQETIQGSDGAASIVSPDEANIAPTRRVVQTFYVETQQPNVVFGAYRPSEVYFPAGGLRVDRYGSIRSPILLDTGTIYSVVSEVPIASPTILRTLRPSWPADLFVRYTQIPDSLPARVGELAHRIADDQPTVYDKVMAVQGWLHRNTGYNLGIPPDPPGADPIDTFLFERRQGFCEHIATSMALLLREVGVPTRLVTGFGPGERNPFTGYFEVRQKDAHAWVEVLYPGIGWVPYDPTFGVPNVAGGLGSRFIAPEVFRSIGRAIAGVVPESVKRGAGAVGSSIAAVSGAALRWWPLAVATMIVVVGLLAWRRHKRRRWTGGPPPTGAAAAFAQLVEAFVPRGVKRRASETPSEFLRDLERRSDVPPDTRGDATLVVRTFERERFSARRPSEEEILAALAASARVRERERELAASRARESKPSLTPR